MLLSPDPGQHIPNLLLAAVHDVILAAHEPPGPSAWDGAVRSTAAPGMSDPDGGPWSMDSGGLDDDVVALSAWYSSVTDDPRPVGSGADDPWPYFRRLALHHSGVEQRLLTQATQTNEVGRCATLLLALSELMPTSDDRPLGLVDVGASAGLNLLLDRYGYQFRPDQGATVPARRSSGARPGHDATGPGGWESAQADGVGDGGSARVAVGEFDGPLVLSCAWRGSIEPPIPAKVPNIVSRVGVDRVPVDLSDPDQARWLVACQWPDQLERVRRARLAIDLALGAVGGGLARVEEGDAVDDLARLVSEVDAGALPVVVSTWVLSYLTTQRQGDFVAELDRIGAERDLSLVFSEQPELVPGLVRVGALPPRPDGGPDGSATALVRIDWRSGEGRARRLADQHPHGTWVEWLVPTTG